MYVRFVQSFTRCEMHSAFCLRSCTTWNVLKKYLITIKLQGPLTTDCFSGWWNEDQKAERPIKTSGNCQLMIHVPLYCKACHTRYNKDNISLWNTFTSSAVQFSVGVLAFTITSYHTLSGNICQVIFSYTSYTPHTCCITADSYDT